MKDQKITSLWQIKHCGINCPRSKLNEDWLPGKQNLKDILLTLNSIKRLKAASPSLQWCP